MDLFAGADETLSDQMLIEVPAAPWEDEGEEDQEHHLVPARLVRVANRLKELDDADDSNTVSALQRMKLPQMTGQIRDVEQRALEIGREEGREEVRALRHRAAGAFFVPFSCSDARPRCFHT